MGILYSFTGAGSKFFLLGLSAEEPLASALVGVDTRNTALSFMVCCVAAVS